MTRWIFVAPLAAALTLVVGCGKGTSSGSGYVPKKKQELASAILPAGQEANYWPMAEGNQWTYQSESGQNINGRQVVSGKREVTYKITKISQGPGGARDATFDVLDEANQLTDRQIWRVDSGGIYQVAAGKTLSRFSSPQLVLRFPVKTGDEFTWNASFKDPAGKMRHETSKTTVGAQQPIDTLLAAGEYNALTLTSTGTVETDEIKGAVSNSTWLIPNVGLGRFYQEISGDSKKQKAKFIFVTKLVLKSYSLKK